MTVDKDAFDKAVEQCIGVDSGVYLYFTEAYEAAKRDKVKPLPELPKTLRGESIPYHEYKGKDFASLEGFQQVSNQVEQLIDSMAAVYKALQKDGV